MVPNPSEKQMTPGGQDPRRAITTYYRDIILYSDITTIIL
jgi:hypothetical protein